MSGRCRIGMGGRTFIRSTGFHRKIGSADPKAESEPGPLPWSVRSGRPSVEQPLA